MVKYWQFDDEYPIVDMYFFKIRVMYVKFQFENLRFMVYGLKNPLYVHCIWIGYDRPIDYQYWPMYQLIYRFIRYGKNLIISIGFSIGR